MTAWFRSWSGEATDPKWIAVARKAIVPPGVVLATVWALLDHASQQRDPGDVSTFDAESFSAFAGLDEPDVHAVINALAEKGVIRDGRVADWARRQPKDRTAAERQRRKRARDFSSVTPADAPSPAVTPRHVEVTAGDNPGDAQ